MKELSPKTNSNALESRELLRAEYYPTRLMVCGKPGTGQSAIAVELSRRSGIELVRTGQDKRAAVREATGEEIIAHHPVDQTENQRIDNKVKMDILSATPSNKIIIDAKLSNVIFREVIKQATAEGNEPLEGVGILVVAKGEVRYERIRQRQIKKHMEKTGLSRKAVEKDPQFSPRAIRKATIERERGDIAGWRLDHPQLEGIDPFDPVNRDKNGDPIFDYYINTTNLSIEEGADLIEKILKNRYLQIQRTKNFPQNGVVLKA